ncbi:EAL domain-containing response regulator [Arenimonas fontis]|uniref:EAL domain-containing protein n=1 Tax=Arenimonas fontis TaxID=2608255 RepID=A0A5B2Z8W2_9GAMM|nr:EAL domain-containing response regulator [Arenimonas fontis]KAA2284335.1 EAL domain-containing protein [Arenimonas fontis]
MNPHDESRLADHRHAFLRHLPRRVELIGRRLHRFLQDGWDINGLALIHDDARWLGAACQRHGLDEAGQHLGHLHGLLAQTLRDQELPDPALGERLWRLIEEIGEAVPMLAEVAAEPAAPGQQAQTLRRAETPPAHYWRRWGDDAPPPARAAAGPAGARPSTQAELAPAASVRKTGAQAGPEARNGTTAGTNPAPAPATSAPATSAPATSAPTAPAPAAPAQAAAAPAHRPVADAARAPRPAAQPAPPRPVPRPPASAPPAPVDGLRVYHLTDHGPLSLELDQRMEALGYEVELLESAEELHELLGALPAHLALVDAAFQSRLEAIGETVRQARERGPHRILLVALSETDDINLRLAAQRAGVDALVIEPDGAQDVLRRLAQLLQPGPEEPYRVLIVEDDRGQALFAEGILRNAGMETRVVLDSLDVLAVLNEFQPDLVLMDLHMPHANGIELTVLIREQDGFLDTPIVFLSGEPDPDRQFDVLEAGGDDFIAKPVRPRHLIAAVQNRIQRHRATLARRGSRHGRDPATGLHDRGELMARLEARLAGGQGGPGGVLFLEVESVNLLRDRLGLTALEQLLAQVGRMVAERAGDTPVARFGDGSYLLLDEQRDGAGLETLASQLRGALVQHPFDVHGHPLRLRVSVGICAFEHRLADAAAVLNAVERAAREARTSEKGVRSHEPAQPSEAAREASLVQQIREAIALNRLELHYQPVVAVAGSDDSQYQVLLRLRDAEGKLLPAAEVVPLAERGDFILDIDRWVLTAALKLIRQRRAEGKPLRLFVTQSALTLADPGQAAWLKSELAAHDVPGTSLVIELRLEDAAVHAATVREFCDRMLDDGVQFCLSQFEAGREPESLLDRLPLGFVKLARKYTASVLPQPVRDELRVLIERCHRHGLEVIGHGVEDPQAAATLWMSGIDFIQGNLVQQADTDMDFDFQQAVL